MSNEYLNNKAFELIIARFQKSKRDKSRFEFMLEDLRETQQRKQLRVPSLLTTEDERMTTNVQFYNQSLTDHKDSQIKLALAFYTLSENIVRYAKFNLIDADDAIQEGVMICFEKIDRFDPRKGKAFNYMTTCILNHFRQLYRSARNYHELKKKYHDFLSIQISNSAFKNGKELALSSSYSKR